MKLYAIYAIICIANAEAPRGISCLEYHEPITKVYKAKECYEKAQAIGDVVKQEFKKDNIKIIEHIIWCVNDKGEPI